MERPLWKRVSVEPVLFLYMSAFMLTSVVEEAFFVHKACRVNLNFSREVCDNISSAEYLDYKKQVQVEVSLFHQWENVATHGVPILLAFFLGSWSDRVGRKLPLLLGLLGNFAYSFMIVVNDLQESWPVEMILYTACLPCALTGGNLTVFMAAFSYLADTTSQEERTLRTTLLEVSYLIPMPLGVAAGSYLFYNVFDRSYGAMFAVNCSLLVTAILYTLLVLKWRTVNRLVVSEEEWTLFNWRHAVESLKSLTCPRPDSRRKYLLLILLAMSLYTFQREEKHMIYLYSQLRFGFDVLTFSRFRTFQSTLFILGLLVGVPLMTKCLGMRDTVVVMIGATSHILARVVFASAQVPYVLYVGAGIGLLGPTVAPVLRSVVSKLVPPSERGKIFAMFSVADTSVPLVSGFIYSQIYNATMSVFPQSVFVVTAVSQLVVLSVALYIHGSLRGRKISQAEDSEQDLDYS